MINVANAAFWFLAALVLAGSLYQIVSAKLLNRMTAAACPEVPEFAPVTILKPLCGLEPEMESNLRSFCQQDYPEYQIVFGVHDVSDTALPILEGLQREFPHLSIDISIGKGRPKTGNPKVANLQDMLAHARHDILILSDSDTFAEPGCLKALAATLAQPGVGISTSLYIGKPLANFWSRLGAMGINHNFLPSIAIAQALGRQDGCFGAAICLRRETLERIGGFEPVRELLADDYYLGAGVRKLGLKIGLAPCWPHCTEFEPDLRTLFLHEVRWGRTLASIERLGYAFSLVTLAIPFALLSLAFQHGWLGWANLAIAALTRLWAIRSEESTLSLDRHPIWMIFLRDLLSVAVHLTALSGRTIYWRDRYMRLGSDGSLHPLKTSAKP